MPTQAQWTLTSLIERAVNYLRTKNVDVDAGGSGSTPQIDTLEEVIEALILLSASGDILVPPNMRVHDGWIQWIDKDGAWNNLVELATLTGSPGESGPRGIPGLAGEPGRQITLNVGGASGTILQYQYIDGTGLPVTGAWIDIYDLGLIKGSTPPVLHSTHVLSTTIGDVTTVSDYDVALAPITGQVGVGATVFDAEGTVAVLTSIDAASGEARAKTIAVSGLGGGELGGTGIPTGGSAGQVLAKKTDADYDAEWRDAPNGSSGISSVEHDATLTGDGTPSAPLGVSQSILDQIASGEAVESTATDIASSTLSIGGSGFNRTVNLTTEQVERLEKAETAVQLDQLADVATSGNYNDLVNKPTIPTVETLTSQEISNILTAAGF